MTVEELIVYNSTIPAGEGTVLEHLQNININRQVFCGVDVDVKNAMDISVTSGIIAANVVEDKLNINIEDDMTTDIIDSKIGANL